MARTPNPKIREKDLHGYKHFKLLLPVMQKLHDHRCRRDKAGIAFNHPYQPHGRNAFRVPNSIARRPSWARLPGETPRMNRDAALDC